MTKIGGHLGMISIPEAASAYLQMRLEPLLDLNVSIRYYEVDHEPWFEISQTPWTPSALFDETRQRINANAELARPFEELPSHQQAEVRTILGDTANYVARYKQQIIENMRSNIPRGGKHTRSRHRQRKTRSLRKQRSLRRR